MNDSRKKGAPAWFLAVFAALPAVSMIVWFFYGFLAFGFWIGVLFLPAGFVVGVVIAHAFGKLVDPLHERRKTTTERHD